MNNWLFLYGTAFAGGCGMCLLLTPVFRIIAAKTGLMDVPANNHKGHRKATPLLGGAAMYLAWLICLVAGAILVISEKLPGFESTFAEHFPGFKFALSELAFLVIAATGAVILGLIDDKFALSASVKFAGQFIIALVAVLGGGVRVSLFISNPVLVKCVSVFWIMLMMNSINFFDNMDGLAAGTIAIATGFFTVIAALNNQYFVALFAALSCGVCCGFWFYNSAPASIFMGDSGSHFIGFLAAVIAAQVTCFDSGYSLSHFPVLIPALILALPLFDTMMVVIIRTLNKKPFWIGDHNHISHRFARMGLTRPQAVLAVHLLALALGSSTLPIYWGDFTTAAILVFQAVLLLALVTILQCAGAKKD
ncbi:MAG: undecaprenyl/decaprenyl-phosphate alpha-N-acetylglucosaminyl 1-phosphate transferase [Lentisphaerae bacterium]|nr:undecaprenyl/decaprenyl-phosphate alpha-N-acetylglucosaminyl 1-phosphate transferase [Lentisphaerota bacterium]